MGRFSFTSTDGTTVTGWRSDHRDDSTTLPILICNGLGTPPTAWPTVVADPRLDVRTWYYRGTAGGSRPADAARVTVGDHAADALALLDHEKIDRVVVACWSLGVNTGFELARRHPDRVAGIMAVAGVPGGTFEAMGEPLRIPKRLRKRIGVSAAHLGRAIGPQLSWVSTHIPLNRVTATVISHTGFVMPAAKPERLMPALAEFRDHDFRWYFTLALAASNHQPMDLSFLDVPVTLVAGRYDVLTSLTDMVDAAARIPHAELRLLPGSHFLPLEYPDELAVELYQLALRTDLASRLGDEPASAVPTAPAAAHVPVAHRPSHRSPS